MYDSWWLEGLEGLDDHNERSRDGWAECDLGP